ncbi:MAG TPA: cupredoxin domain-containing protein [Mycobacteriales bacterium]|nr:cupredoxin domain-containing protein [Mycobacteriales bacterium]
MRRLLAACLGIAVAIAGCGGSSSESAKAARQIKIATSDQLRFDPASVSAQAGEKVTFVITNPGALEHEFTIGDADYLKGHAGEGGGHGGGHGDSKDGATVKVPAGKTARLTFTMPSAAPSYACHVDNHDKSGMTGTVTYA